MSREVLAIAKPCKMPGRICSFVMTNLVRPRGDNATTCSFSSLSPSVMWKRGQNVDASHVCTSFTVYFTITTQLLKGVVRFQKHILITAYRKVSTVHLMVLL
jgi:hypothetical protein